jgi:hypothetical protein
VLLVLGETHRREEAGNLRRKAVGKECIPIRVTRRDFFQQARHVDQQLQIRAGETS